MSRSRKKSPVIKDSSNRENKALASRKLRRITKIEVAKGEEIITNKKEGTNQYDICDYKFFAPKGEEDKFKRK